MFEDLIPKTFIERVAPPEIQSRYFQPIENIFNWLLIKNYKKEEDFMAEIKYTILSDDGDNIKYEKAIIETEDTSRAKIADYKARIEAIKAHIEEENKELADLESKLEEEEKVIAIADEAREAKLEEEKVSEEVVVDSVVENADVNNVVNPQF